MSTETYELSDLCNTSSSTSSPPVDTPAPSKLPTSWLYARLPSLQDFTSLLMSCVTGRQRTKSPSAPYPPCPRIVITPPPSEIGDSEDTVLEKSAVRTWLNDASVPAGAQLKMENGLMMIKINDYFEVVTDPTDLEAFNRGNESQADSLKEYLSVPEDIMSKEEW